MPLTSLNADQLRGISDLLQHTDNVKTIVSFGARDGGFELSMQFRHDLYQKKKDQPSQSNDSATHYLDAASLSSHKFTNLVKLDGIDVFKMENPFWDIAYKNGIEHAGKMVFFITPEWLGSKFCKQEFEWANESKNTGLKHVFVMFKDTDSTDDEMKGILDFAEKNQSLVVWAETSPENGLNDVDIKDSVSLSFKRLLSESESSQIESFLLENEDAPPGHL